SAPATTPSEHGRAAGCGPCMDVPRKSDGSARIVRLGHSPDMGSSPLAERFAERKTQDTGGDSRNRAAVKCSGPYPLCFRGGGRATPASGFFKEAHGDHSEWL